MVIDVVWDHDYSQSNTLENFAQNEVAEVVRKTKKELDALRNSIQLTGSENISWWKNENINEAISAVESMYRIEWNNVVYDMKNVTKFLASIYSRMISSNAPDLNKQRTEDTFPWTVFAVQVALEALNRGAPFIWKYDVWVINWQFNARTQSIIKEFQLKNTLRDFSWIINQETIWALLSALKTEQFDYMTVKDWFRPLWKLSVVPDILFDETTFKSSRFERNPRTWCTLCSKTAQLNARKVWLRLQSWNAFDAIGKRPIDNHYVDTVPHERVGQRPNNWWKPLKEAEFNGQIANFAEFAVSSKSRYWHRATAIRWQDGYWHVLDPYRVGWRSTKPMPLWEYMAIVWKNWGGIVEAHFYDTTKNDTKAVA